LCQVFLGLHYTLHPFANNPQSPQAFSAAALGVRYWAPKQSKQGSILRKRLTFCPKNDEQCVENPVVSSCQSLHYNRWKGGFRWPQAPLRWTLAWTVGFSRVGL